MKLLCAQPPSGQLLCRAVLTAKNTGCTLHLTTLPFHFPLLLSAQLLLLAKADDLKPSSKLMKGYKAGALANKGKLVFVTVNAVSTWWGRGV